MAITVNTDVAAAIPERWELEAMKFRYAEAVLAARMKTASENLLSYGDIYHFPIKTELTPQTISASTAAFTASTLSMSDPTITVNTWKAVPFEVSMLTKRQSAIDIKSAYAPDCGKALAADTDGALAATTPDLSVGSADNPQKFDKSHAFAALLKLADKNLPYGDLSFFLPPIAILEGWMTQQEATAANMMGLPKSVITTGFIQPILGVPIYQTTKLTSSASAYNAILAHREWQGLVTQIKLDVVQSSGVAAGKLTDIYVAHTVYGYGALRSDYAVRMFITKTSAFGN